jgi:hypothetical protein
MSPRLLSVICLVAIPAMVLADRIVYQVERVDTVLNVLTIKSSTLQEISLHVLPGAEVTINGAEATLGDLRPRMTVKVTTSEPGVAQRIDAETPSGAAQATPIPSAGFADDLLGSDDQTGRVIKAIIPANSPNAFLINGIRKGTKISFHYISGNWKSWGSLATANPDDENTEGGEKCRLALALPSADGNIGDVVAIIPPDTKLHGFIFEAQQDYPSLVLRINGKAFKGPGQVIYSLHIEPPQE